MKILMIGLGSVGQRHLRNIKRVYGDKFEIIAFRTRRLQETFSDNMQIRDGINLEAEYGLKVYSDLSLALQEKPDIAYITNITSKHVNTAIICAKAGCNLFIEKPLSNSLENVEELKRIVSEKELIVFMGFQNRYHVCIQETRRLLRAGTIGAIQSVDCEFSERLTTMHAYEDYRQSYMANAAMGGGPVLNLQIHDLDLLYYLFGNPLNVFSILSKNSRLEVDVEDAALAIYTFENDSGNVFPVYSHTDFLQYPPVHTFKIVGEQGRIEIDMNKASLKVIVNGSAINDISYSDFQRNDMFIKELKDFIDCVQKKSSPEINLDQGIISLRMALAAKQSSYEKKVINMEEI